MPIINVQMLPGRTGEQKKAFIKAVSEIAVSTLAVPEEAIRILITEVDADHWSIGSRTMADIRFAAAKPPQS